ncbi:6199_t:CDS:2 [Diversispora eburnea]|uniref:6199_t:CDS:1 n=1 Tax=Diversispora eburnea TaxID=1213867 RepID=A0A9N9CGP8_9GLOM|nr:6199_t:CDS:2 [Diversispora eburnea]
MANWNDIRVVISIDFGTTYSGYAYSNKQNPEHITNDVWPERIGQLKTNSVLQYSDSKFSQVSEWGFPALAQKPSRRNQKKNGSKPVELFKLHLGSMPDSEKPTLPKGLDYKKAITDYLKEMETVEMRWPNIDFMSNVLIVMTVPAEYSEQACAIMRECAYKAGLIRTKDSKKLEFSTEPEAAAIYCMSVLKEHFLTDVGTNFLIVDCGGGTVDLTTRELLADQRLGEVTERTGDFCGGTYVDKEFIKFLKRKVGDSAIKLLEEQNYGQLQYMIQEFCTKVKLPFTGVKKDYKLFELDLEEVCPVLKQYTTGAAKAKLEKDEWIIDLDFETVKSFFDPVIGKIIRLVSNQLNNGNDCSAMFLVGGFSESKYLQRRIKDEFGMQVKNISVPKQPQAAIVRGGLEYGLNMKTIKTRVLKWTYGIELSPQWKPGDPPERRISHNRIDIFSKLVSRGTIVDVDQEFGKDLYPSIEDQTAASMKIYKTPEIDGKYPNEPGMEKLGELILDFPESYLGYNRKLRFTLTFGQMEIRAYCTNQNGKSVDAMFNLEL